MLNELKQKPKNKITRADIAELLKSIAPAGKKPKTKINAVSELGLYNSQGVNVTEILSDFEEF